jgi:hypothetical protein
MVLCSESDAGRAALVMRAVAPNRWSIATEGIAVKIRYAVLAGCLGLALIGCGGGTGGGSASDSGNGDSTGANRNRATPIANLSGDWSVAESGTSTCAGSASYTVNPYQITISQTGNDLVVVAPGGTFQGSIDGDKVAWSGSYPNGSGRTTITSMALIVAASGNAISGSGTWTWADGTSSCAGTSQSINVTRIPGTGPVPAAPSALSASGSSASAVQLVWNDNSSNETGFKIERRLSADASSPFSQIALVGAGTTSYTDSGLNALTAYDYRVRATNSAGDSAYSNVSTATTLAALLPAPSALTLTVNSLSSISLRWSDNSTSETSFRIERSTNANNGFDEIAIVAAGTTSYRNDGLMPGTRYFYRVRASNATGNSAYSNTADASTLPAPAAPAAPSNLSASAPSSSVRVVLTWRDNSNNETSFLIERSTNANSGFSQISTTVANVTTYTDTSVQERTRYFYRVRAANGAATSDYSNTDDATTPRD